jgi:hypothetical protein
MSAPTLYWARWTSGSAQRVVRRSLTRAQLDALRENVEPQATVAWGVEPASDLEGAGGTGGDRDRVSPGTL